MIEVINRGASAPRAKAIVFDFDGTISLLRSGWMDVMVPMCLEQLKSTPTKESEDQLRGVVENFVWRLTGKETIYQMMALADAIRERGGEPLGPLEYKRMYLDQLWQRIRHRIEALREGSAKPEQYLVPGVRELLELLVSRGAVLYLASGTDHDDVAREAGLLGVARYFEERIFGAQDDLKSFSKALLVQRILSQTGNVSADELVVFGDGFVEIEEVKKVGGTAVGVATEEPECSTVNQWKRTRLIGAGADFIIPHYLSLDELTAAVFEMQAQTA